MARKNDVLAPEIVARYEAGAPVKDIMREFQLSQDVVYRMVDAAGLPRRGRGNHGAAARAASTSSDSSPTESATPASSVTAGSPQNTTVQKAASKKVAAKKASTKKVAAKKASAKKVAAKNASAKKASAHKVASASDYTAGRNPRTVAMGSPTVETQLISELSSIQARIDDLAGLIEQAEAERRTIAQQLAAR